MFSCFGPLEGAQGQQALTSCLLALSHFAHNLARYFGPFTIGLTPGSHHRSQAERANQHPAIGFQTSGYQSQHWTIFGFFLPHTLVNIFPNQINSPWKTRCRNFRGPQPRNDMPVSGQDIILQMSPFNAIKHVL